MPDSQKSNKTILIVDDEDRDLNTACQILVGEGFTVLAAGSYARAISVGEDNLNRVDLLIADVTLPDGDACDLALRLRDCRPDLRVLFVSGHAGAEVCRFYGLDQTSLHFLKKPFKPKQICERVHRVLNAAETFPQLHRKYRTA
jgi:DNA-binding response OmpR family regulator